MLRIPFPNLGNFEFTLLNFAFLTSSLSKTLLSFFKPTGIFFSLSASVLFTLDSILFKSVRTVVNLSISHFSTSDFKLAKSTFFANDNVPPPVAFSYQLLLHN